MAEEPVVAVRRIVATANLRRIMTLVIQPHQQVDIGFCLRGVGVDEHQALVAATEKVDIHQELHLVELDERHISEIATSDNTRLLTTEEEEDVGVFIPAQKPNL